MARWGYLLAVWLLPLWAAGAVRPAHSGAREIRTQADTTVRLDSAVATGNRSLRQQADRIVYDVSADPDAFRINMSEMVRKIPGLTISPETGTLLWQEKPITRILIDGQQNGMVNERRQYPMRFIQAAYMNEVALILPGSPEYGNDGPILAISLRESLPYGLAAELSAQADVQNTYGIGADMVANMPLTGVGVNYRFDWSAPPSLTSRTERSLYDESDRLLSTSVASTGRTSLNRTHTAGLVFFRPCFNKFLNVDLSLTGAWSDNTLSSQSEQTVTPAGGSAGVPVSRLTLQSDRPFLGEASLRLVHPMGRGKSLSLTYRLSGETGSPTDEYALLERICSDNRRLEHTVRMALRWRSPSRKNQWGLNADAAYIGRNYASAGTRGFFNTGTGLYDNDPAYDAGLDYHQDVASLQAGFLGFLLQNRLSYDVSLRGDGVFTRGYGPGGTPLGDAHWNLVPRISVFYKRGLVRFGGGYSARVSRPRWENLSPVADGSDLGTVRVGNSSLRESVSHSFSAVISVMPRSKWFEIATLSYNPTIYLNNIQRFTDIAADHSATTTFVNIPTTTAHELMAEMHLRPLRVLSFSLSGRYCLQHYRFDNMQTGNRQYFVLQSGAQLTLGEWTGKFRFGCLPSSASVQSIREVYDPVLGLSVSRYFEKIHLGVSLEGNDLLHGRSFVQSSLRSGLSVQNNFIQRAGRNVSLRVYWHIGKFRTLQPVKVEDID